MSDLDRYEQNFMAGQFAIDALKAIECLPDNARLFHDGVEKCLREAGFRVWREVPTFWRESGRGYGRIDLFAVLDGEGAVALELDRRSPRSGSLDKLRVFDAFRVVVLRGDEGWTSERGIDAIINIPVPEEDE